MSKTKSLYHLVINTYRRKPTITFEHRRELYAYIHGILKENRCRTYRINGVEDHVHIFFDMHLTVALASLVQSIKQSTSRWLKNPDFPEFSYWGKEYFAFTVSPSDAEAVIQYIKNQEIHHAKTSFEEELKDLLKENGEELGPYDLR